MDNLATEDPNAPGNVSDEMIKGENEAVEQAQAQEATGIITVYVLRSGFLLIL